MDKELIYMAGNGKLVCAFHEGDIAGLFGPPYSSPSVIESHFALNENEEKSKVSHLKKAGIWTLKLLDKGEAFAEVTDFALPGEPCLVRHIESSKEVKFIVSAWSGKTNHFDYEIYADAAHPEKGFLLKTKNGNPVYNDYPLPFPQFYSLMVRGEGKIEKTAPYRYEITVNGKADFLITGGPSFPECDMASQRICEMPYEEMLEKAIAWWADEFAAVKIADNLPETLPEKELFIKAVQDTVINLVVQQAEEGGVLAGSPFPLGYVRDQYGVCMCMLKLGLIRRAKLILKFYCDVFRHNGKIMNAQAMGVNGLFHFAENDSTEITGYLLFQFFRYAEITNDYDLLRENIEFLVWLYKQQLSQIHNYMLPFNGDETYIAGDLLPRDVINEGSAEATMLFVLSGRKLLDFLRAEGIDKLNLLEIQSILDSVESKYKDNFVIEGRYTLNNPERRKGLLEPQYRYGVCMNLGKDDCVFFGWTSLYGDGIYLCPKCASGGVSLRKINKKFYLPSALLMPAFVNSHLPEDSVILSTLNEFAVRFERDGYLYSDEVNMKNVGYDYGLLLLNYLKYDIPGKEKVYSKLLSLMDEVGTWSERYVKDIPHGVRYRPWESAINLYALIEYCEYLKK